MRVLHVVHQYLPDAVGGTELYVQTLAQAQVQHGHRPAVFAPQVELRENLVHDTWQGIPVYRARATSNDPTTRFRTSYGDSSLSKAFNLTLDEWAPDLVHIHHLMGLPADIIETVKQRGIPLIATLHDYWLICSNAQLLTNYDQTVCGGPRLWMNCARCVSARLDKPALNLMAPAIAAAIGWRDRLLRQAVRQIDLFIAPTQFVRNLFVKIKWIPAERLVHIPHGISVEGVRAHKPRLAGSPLRVTYVGGISWQKGVHVLVEAVRLLEPTLAQLVVLGNLGTFPDYSRELRAQATGCEHIRLQGPADRSQVWQTLAETDVLVVPSLWYETAALVIQEAFAAGVPVIASNLGALNERVRHGQDGFLFPAGDSSALAALLQRLAREPELLEQLQSGIRPVMEIEQHVSLVLDHYHQVLSH